MGRRWLDFWHSLSGIGLLLGTLFFAAALTPTLVPRTFLTQGVLSGACFALGYGIGVFWRWLWAYLELPEPRERFRLIANTVIAILCAAVAVYFLWRAAEWQNSIRLLMQMEPVTSAHPTKLSLIALLTFITLLVLARLFRQVARFVAARMRRIVPRRVANVIGVVLAVLLFWLLANDMFFRLAIQAADSSFREFDALIEPDSPKPTLAVKTGSSASLVRWTDLGRAGREFVASGPTAAAISALTGRAALEPIRVYVGLNAAESPEQRARLALAELKRVGAFERSLLVVITPTGTGWIDPSALDSLEYLHEGDVASVAQQYSYLSSPLSLLVQPEYGEEAARALFREVYAYWTTLPKDRRPRLYLHGLSLGAMNSEKSAQLFEMIGDPIDGALWSGPPFASRGWRSVTDLRNAGSPAWLPQFRDGSFVRFMNQNGLGATPAAPWGPMRIVYLQYASDAVTFFDFRDLYRSPAWMERPRGPDVSPELTWYPLVTMLQLALDMAVATTTPMGFGHVYAPEHYVDAWIEVTGAPGWTADDIARLKQHLKAARTDGKKSDENRGG
ncbi:hypothetical protein G5V57_01920 [Nordella sp. HKS 07]|uniref:alpha/beta hydrolase n=1 Tax=Nordella sp. HKS 07 TaxID=2712222 RepID=UPI0013E1960B|nr:alpha/beta-hydrolase family protein [Nordella sp. HKS 07]QIG46624.1 hypothetical protein G5V57_01920 [Nordella sp. HKS 07]